MTTITAPTVFIPEVRKESEFLEICNDFTEPREVLREAISNAFDAGATVIKVTVHVDRSSGIDELVTGLADSVPGSRRRV